MLCRMSKIISKDVFGLNKFNFLKLIPSASYTASEIH